MDFKLNVQERLTLLNMFPSKNNFINTKIIREASSTIGLSDEEAVEFEVKHVGENISYHAKKGSVEKTIKIGERAYSIICEVLEKLDKENKLTQNHFTLYEKFINRENKDK